MACGWVDACNAEEVAAREELVALAAAESGGTVEVWRERLEGWDGTRSERVREGER